MPGNLFNDPRLYIKMNRSINDFGCPRGVMVKALDAES